HPLCLIGLIIATSATTNHGTGLIVAHLVNLQLQDQSSDSRLLMLVDGPGYSLAATCLSKRVYTTASFAAIRAQVILVPNASRPLHPTDVLQQYARVRARQKLMCPPDPEVLC